MRFKLIVFMILIVLFTIFVVQNTEPVNMQLFFWQLEELPKIILLIVTLVFGIIMGILLSTFFSRKRINRKTDVDSEIKKEKTFHSGKV